MPTVPALSEAVKKQILRHARGQDADTMLRIRAVVAVAGGRSRHRVAAVLGCVASTVVRAVARFVQGGFEALEDRRRRNGMRKISDDYLGMLHAVVEQPAGDFGWHRPTWTRESLALTMAQLNFPAVAPCTLGRALAAIGARRGRPKPAVGCPWPPALRDKTLRALRRLENRASEKEPVLFSDEVDIHLNPKVGLDWMNRGQQRQLMTPGQNDRHYLAGALDALTRKLIFVDGTRKTSALFCKLLDVLVQAYPDARTIHLILDNYRIHKSRAVDKHLAELGGRIVLHFLPPYCPDHNRIERAWQELHANVTRNHRCPDMLALLVRVFIYLFGRNDDTQVKPSLRRALPVAA
jgi:transposase